MPSKYSEWKCKCGKKYIPAKKVYGGYVYECDSCSFVTQQEDIDWKAGRTDKYVGRMSEKSNEGIIIFRNDIAAHKLQLRLESSRGMAPNLNITSPVGALVRQQEDENKSMEKEPTIEEVLKEKEDDTDNEQD